MTRPKTSVSIISNIKLVYSVLVLLVYSVTGDRTGLFCIFSLRWKEKLELGMEILEHLGISESFIYKR
jgi:hypothetical protein